MKFEQLLVTATAITGVIVVIDKLFFRESRATNSGARQEPILVEYARAFFPVLLFVLILRSFIAEPFRIPSGSMKPTLLEGDFILVNKFTYGLKLPMLGTKFLSNKDVKRGDVIVFRHENNQDLIKRVVGLPGDRITYRNKVLSVNGEMMYLTGKDLVRDHLEDGNQILAYKQVEKLGDLEHLIFIYPGAASQTYKYENFTVPKNSYFVLGDNRDNSKDSRFWGEVPNDAIIGRAFAIWWSSDAMAFKDLITFWKIKVRWDRVFTAIE